MLAVLAWERLWQNELINLGYEVLLEVLSRFFTRTHETDEQPGALSRARSASWAASCGLLGNRADAAANARRSTRSGAPNAAVELSKVTRKDATHDT
jgi:hypothetical protein